MRRKNYIYTLLSLLAAAILALGSLKAETLKDIKGSRAMQKILLDTKKARQTRDGDDVQGSWLVGIEPTSNFAELFGSGKGPRLLLNWAGTNLYGYRLTKEFWFRKREYAHAILAFRDLARNEVLLNILVPHPTYKVMAQLKTLGVFNQFVPPQLKVQVSEELDIKGHKAKFYRTPNAKCSIHIELEKLGILNLSVKSCKNSRMMMDVARRLDLERLNRKLST